MSSVAEIPVADTYSVTVKLRVVHFELLTTTYGRSIPSLSRYIYMERKRERDRLDVVAGRA